MDSEFYRDKVGRKKSAREMNAKLTHLVTLFGRNWPMSLLVGSRCRCLPCRRFI